MTWANLIFGITGAVFLGMTLAALWHARWARQLPSWATLAATGDAMQSPPVIRCSVVVAARDEEARLEQTIRCLLAQRGVEAEFIVVDDRSTDQTSAILRR